MKTPKTANPKARPEPTSLAYLRRQVKKFDRLHCSSEDINEEVCTKYLDPKSVNCKNCGSKNIARDCGERVGQCLDCRKKVHYTAGTFFHKKRILRCWLLCVWLFEKGIVFNPSQFHQVAGIAYSTAWTIFKKISLAVQYLLDRQEAAIDVDSAYFIQLFSRRSLLTPAGAHPSVEQKTIEKSALTAGTAGGVAAAVESLRLNHQGLSRKYLQIHMASYWCQKVRNSASSFSIREACMLAPEITNEDIRNFVTPLKVKLIAA